VAIDDLRPALGCYGNEHVRTPNIDRLARAGTVFSKAYCNWPVCGPSRASMMTSLRPETVGVMDLATDMRLKEGSALLSLPQHFKNQGYTTAGAGKIYDTRNVDSARECDAASWSLPFDTYGVHATKWATEATRAAMEAEIRAQGNVYNLKHWGANTSLVLAPDCTEDELPDGSILQVGLSLMRQLVSGREREGSPWFLAVGFNKPHLPFWAPKKYWDLYHRELLPHIDDGSLEATADINHHSGWDVHDSFEFRDYFPVPPEGPIPSEVRREALHGYYACISYIDHQVGELMNQLASIGGGRVADETAVVLWGDHGFHVGDHGMWGKHTNLENGARMPLIIVPPGGSAVRRVDSPVELIDVFPTLVTLAGLPMPAQLQGRSLQPLLTGALTAVHEGAITLNDAWWATSGGGWPRARPVNARALGYSYRTERYRYTQWVRYVQRSQHGGNTSEDKLAGWSAIGVDAGVTLFDYEADPTETNNIAGEAESAEVVRRLGTALLRDCIGCERLLHGIA